MTRLSVEGISVGVTPACGMLEGLVIERGGRRIASLHRLSSTSASWCMRGSRVTATAPA